MGKIPRVLSSGYEYNTNLFNFEKNINLNHLELFKQYIKDFPFPKAFEKDILYVLEGGQHFRPQLLLAWCEYAGGDINKALPLALAFELIHAGSLIQDDLPCMDNATTRRNKVCLHLHKSEAEAIMCGNILLSLSFSLISQLETSDSTKEKLVEILFYAIQKMNEGQLIELTSQPNSVENWLSVHRLKTASLIEKACEAGAVSVVDGYAVINASLCTACGACTQVCPRGIIRKFN